MTTENPTLESHEIDYRLLGDTKQIIEILLDPGETVVADAGAFLAKRKHIKLATVAGVKGTYNPTKKAWRAVQRSVTKENIFMTRFTNTSGREKEPVWFGAPYPGEFIPINLAQIDGPLMAQKGAFLAGAYGVELSAGLSGRPLTAGMFGGEGWILQRITGDGLLILHARGSHTPIYLDNESLQVATSHLVAFEERLTYKITKAGNIRSMLFAREGLLLTELEGTGWLWIQSQP